MKTHTQRRAVISTVMPEINHGKYPVRRVIGEKIEVSAHIFADGHDEVAAVLLYRPADTKKWKETPLEALANDEWKGAFTVEKPGTYYYTIQAWVNHFKTWQGDIKKRFDARQNIRNDIKIGMALIEEAAATAPAINAKKLSSWLVKLKAEKNEEKLLALLLNMELLRLMTASADPSIKTEYDKQLEVYVDRKKARFSSWYEFFPRSFSPVPLKHGTFKDCERLLPGLAEMGFDVIYLPPIHPIGKTKRKGKNNNVVASKSDPGSPWAIGSQEGGHMAVHPELGTLADFSNFLKKAKKIGMDVALDLAYQCSQDHPYIKEHPEWFLWRPDGTIQFAENPPKKYEDVVPFNFETEHWQALWDELRNIAVFWIKQGVRIFRVDNPHTKPFPFWEWLISGIKKEYPDVLFLAEAFTRPKKMYHLAKIGFTQSYTYFTWRYSKKEFIDYMNELAKTEVREYFKPNFWPNTPDILSEDLQRAPKSAFVKRLVLAATLSSNYGMYGPAFELMDNDPFPGKEEYNNNEKYEIKNWNRNRPGNLRDMIARVNGIRNANAALQETSNLQFCDINNDQILAYLKMSPDKSNAILTVVNLDIIFTQAGWLRVPLQEMGIAPGTAFFAHDLLNAKTYEWRSEWNYIELNPQHTSAHIFKIERQR